jgi:biopolymer transport protein TolQ
VIESITLGNSTPMGHSVVNLVVNAGALAKIVLLLLLLFSLGSWGIMLDKFLQFSRLKKSSVEFLRLFKRAENLDDLASKLRKTKSNPLARIFAAGYRHLEHKPGENPSNPVFTPKNTTRMDLALDDAIMTEIQNLEQRVTFLGTCGSITPFLGLFGTVWGIMTAFRGIGVVGSASIAAVAPGIAEALITTAAGLAAAIPAVMAYNHFLNKIRSANIMFERFRSSFIALLE